MSSCLKPSRSRIRTKHPAPVCSSGGGSHPPAGSIAAPPPSATAYAAAQYVSSWRDGCTHQVVFAGAPGPHASCNMMYTSHNIHPRERTRAFSTSICLRRATASLYSSSATGSLYLSSGVNLGTSSGYFGSVHTIAPRSAPERAAQSSAADSQDCCRWRWQCVEGLGKDLGVGNMARRLRPASPADVRTSTPIPKLTGAQNAFWRLPAR